MKERPKVLIEVANGAVASVVASQDLDIRIVDHDDDDCDGADIFSVDEIDPLLDFDSDAFEARLKSMFE